MSKSSSTDDKTSLNLAADLSPSSYPISRTVAIIKPHALRHRFQIERRIQEATFEIVKERQMEFDTETDPDALLDLFGEDAASFSEGPVWVYVLERRRAVEVWNTLMGDPNPEISRKESPNSLRALYGISLEQNGIMGSPDAHSAELQISSLFASSPIFSTAELPDERYGSMNLASSSSSSSVLAALRKENLDAEYAPSTVTNPSTVGGSNSGKLNGSGKPTFKARSIPTTNAQPDIVPRMTRSAALRAGVEVDKKESGPRAPISKERQAQTFANVPGHKRAETIQVASTAAPIIAPRMSRAASLRLGVKPVEGARRRVLSSEDAIKATFEGIPGHKRRETISVASTRPPTVAPRLNKSASLRTQKESGSPPSSVRGSLASKPPATISRTTSLGPLSAPRPSILPKLAARPASQAGKAPVSRYAIPRPSSVAGHNPDTKEEIHTNGTTPAAKPRLSSAAPPSIAPRMNRSAALRAAKQEAENAAAAALAAKRPVRPRAPPSSFKPVAPCSGS